MTQAYGHRFLSSFGQEDNGVWFEALQDLTNNDLSYGFLKLMRSLSDVELKTHESWPPNVKEFRSYCIRQYSDFGLVTPAVAFKEVENNRYMAWQVWSHPLVCLAAESVNALEYHDLPHRLYENFIAFYKSVCEKYMYGEKIVVSNQVLRNRYFRQIDQMQVGKFSNQKTIQFQHEIIM